MEQSETIAILLKINEVLIDYNTELYEELKKHHQEDMQRIMKNLDELLRKINSR